MGCELVLRAWIAAAILALAVATPALGAGGKRVDRDRDGLSDRYERHRSHTSPVRRDTDRDGLSDGREVRRSHTKPRRRDTDGDLLRDGFEVRVSYTSPRRRDTDRDRLTDSWELRVSHTNPRRADTDGDGISDFMEGVGDWDPPNPKPPPPTSNRPDDSPPDTSITSGPSGATTATAASFSFSSTESGSSFECKLNAGSWGGCSSPKSYSELSTTPHVFQVRASDAAGNVDPTPASRTWAVSPLPGGDVLPPDTSITSGPSGTTGSSSASFSFGSSEGGSVFECRLDGGSWGACSSPTAYSNLANGPHSFDVRARDAAGNVDASPASRSWTVSVSSSGGGCDSSVSTQAQLVSAAASAANEGKVVCVADGSYGDLALGGFNHPTKVTLRALNSGQATIGSVSLRNVAGVRFEGFRQTGKFHNDQYAASRIEVARGDIGGGSSTAFLMSDNANDWLIERNHIHDISFNGSFGSGYGIYASGGVPKRGLKVRYNTFERTQSDAMELGNLDGFEIVGNVIDDVKCPGGDCSATHTDALMVWAGSDNGLIKDNRITDSTDVLLSPDGSNTTIENNLIARMSQFCIDAHPNGTSGNVVPTNFTYRQNTIWGCNYNGLSISGALTSGHGGNVLDRNIIKDVSCTTGAIWSISDHNLVGAAACFGGTNVFAFQPAWQDTVNYQPTNLPPGYTDVGYRPAPAGHNAP